MSLAFLLSFATLVAADPVRREVVLTFDDLPGVSMMRSQHCNVSAYASMNRQIVRKLKAHRIPALGLVVEGRLCAERHGALPDILGIWLAAGMELGNHSYSHLDLNNTPLATYQADVIRGERVAKRLLQQQGRKLKYFRHPFLHAGKDIRTRTAFEKFLRDRGYTLAPVTIDNQEWVFAEVYAKAKDRGDSATARQVASVYIAYMNTIFDFFEKRSIEVVGYEMRQILLLHVNPLNADCLDDLVEMMKRRGYTFISMDKALEDPAYRLPDSYAGPAGLSWIHRWAITRGMKVSEEPREPQIIAKLYRDYSANQRPD
jgi:peptidoglycan-N-acetylglucosamine deacetylase